jgi:RNA polymerase sigma-70 factor (ECF subfamily)
MIRRGRVTENDFPKQIRDETRAAWHSYIDFFVPFRPELFRYCRRLTGDVWDAEDLVQDTMLKGFGVLGRVNSVENPPGYLVRIATNLWLDAVRRQQAAERATQREHNEQVTSQPKADPAEVREAAAALMHLLGPQERAAFLLKEVFDMSLEQIAEVLATSVGAVKAALHRGRKRLDATAPTATRRPAPSARLVDRFVERLNAADLRGLLALMLDSATIDMVGNLVEVGRKQFEAKGSWLWQAVNVHPDMPPELRPPKFLNERAMVHGEPMMLGFIEHGNAKILMAIARFEETDGRIARIRSYNFNPEVLQEVGGELGYTVGQVPYRFPTPAPGAGWSDPRNG